MLAPRPISYCSALVKPQNKEGHFVFMKIFQPKKEAINFVPKFDSTRLFFILILMS